MKKRDTKKENFPWLEVIIILLVIISLISFGSQINSLSRENSILKDKLQATENKLRSLTDFEIAPPYQKSCEQMTLMEALDCLDYKSAKTFDWRLTKIGR